MAAPNAIYFAELSAKAYRQYDWRHRQAGVEVLLDRAPWGVTLAFRGTDGVRDAITDIRFAPWYDSRVGWCHAGFLKSTRAIWPSLVFALRHAFLARDPVFLTGHSLGGAQASITAGLMLSEGMKPSGLITFGAPKPAFGGLRRMLAAAGIPRRRFVADGDPVPSLPPSFGLFEHPAEATELPNGHDLSPDHPVANYISSLNPETPAFVVMENEMAR